MEIAPLVIWACVNYVFSQKFGVHLGIWSSAIFLENHIQQNSV